MLTFCSGKLQDLVSSGCNVHQELLWACCVPNTASYAALCVVHMQPYERLEIKLNTNKTIVQVMKSYSP